MIAAFPLAPLILLGLSMLGAALVLIVYPAAVLAAGAFRRPSPLSWKGDLPSVSLVVVLRNAERLVPDKLSNCLALDYPADKLQCVVFSDGSTDGSLALLHAATAPNVTVLAAAEHVGKAEGLNRAVSVCTGEILVFSDVDALLSPDAVHRLVARFGDPAVGGVCGQRVICTDETGLKAAQARYIRFDSLIKLGESRLGRLTSNDGKLYAIRRALFAPVLPAVTDDLFQALNVIRRGARFVFEPAALATIRLPSRSPRHEISRRRRIVSRSLRGIAHHREALNPLRFGLFAAGLLVNKVLRRLLPIMLVLVLIASAQLTTYHPAFLAILIPQIAAYGAAAAYALVPRLAASLPAASTAYYFVVGNLGTLLGLWDFLTGRAVAKWDPLKTET